MANHGRSAGSQETTIRRKPAPSGHAHRASPTTSRAASSPTPTPARRRNCRRRDAHLRPQRRVLQRHRRPPHRRPVARTTAVVGNTALHRCDTGGRPPSVVAPKRRSERSPANSVPSRPAGWVGPPQANYRLPRSAGSHAKSRLPAKCRRSRETGRRTAVVLMSGTCARQAPRCPAPHLATGLCSEGGGAVVGAMAVGSRYRLWREVPAVRTAAVVSPGTSRETRHFGRSQRFGPVAIAPVSRAVSRPEHRQLHPREVSAPARGTGSGAECRFLREVPAVRTAAVVSPGTSRETRHFGRSQRFGPVAIAPVSRAVSRPEQRQLHPRSVGSCARCRLWRGAGCEDSSRREPRHLASAPAAGRPSPGTSDWRRGRLGRPAASAGGDEVGDAGDALGGRLVAEGEAEAGVRGAEGLARHERHVGLSEDVVGELERGGAAAAGKRTVEQPADVGIAVERPLRLDAGDAVDGVERGMHRRRPTGERRAHHLDRRQVAATAARAARWATLETLEVAWLWKLVAALIVSSGRSSSRRANRSSHTSWRRR